LKILEALVLGKPLVATTTAIEGLDVRPGVDLDVADDPAGLANACVRLMEDDAHRQSLTIAGRARALERYEWTSIGQTAERALLQAAERRRTAA
jgi:glycosyltransferase involved in cell wall biosynthesis